MNWINVNDRLPEQDQTVLAYGYFASEIGGEDETEMMIAKCVYNTSYWQIEDTCYYSCWLYEVTHWMPMPEIPKTL